MATRYTDRKLQGIGVCDPRLLNADLVSESDSDYTENSPIPGISNPPSASSRLVPRVHQAQTKDLNVRVENSGMPKLGGLRVAYKPGDEADYMGYNEGNAFAFFDPIEWNSSLAKDAIGAIALKDSQKIVVVAGDQDTSGAIHRTWVYDGSSWTLYNNLSLASESSSLVELPNGRLLWGRIEGSDAEIYYSEDQGETWTLYAVDVLNEIPNETCAGTMVVQGEDILWILQEFGGTNIYQYVSNDYGASFTLIDTMDIGQDARAFPLKDGNGIGLIYRQKTTSYLTYRRIGTPYQSFGDAAAVVISEDYNMDSVCGTSDYDGTIWAYGVELDSGYVWSSTDHGDTWKKQGMPEYGFWKSQNKDTKPFNMYALPCRGHIVIISNHHNTIGSIQKGSLSALWLGGWTNLEHNGMGAKAGTGVHDDGYTWVAFERPTNCGWIGTGTTSNLSSGRLTLTSDESYLTSDSFFINTYYRCLIIFDVICVRGNASSLEAGASIRVADHTLHIRMYPSGFKVLDSVDGLRELGEVVVNMTTERIQIATKHDGDRIKVFYRRPRPGNPWILAVDDTLMDSELGEPDQLIFGNIASASGIPALTRWYSVSWTPQDSRLDGDFNGKAINSSPYPVPRVSDTEDKYAFMSLTGGPGVLGEEYTVPVDYVYRLENLFAGISPSPSEVWRSQDTSEQIIGLEFEGGTDLGAGRFLYLDGVNFRTAYLEYATSLAWTTIGTYDGATGFTDLTYVHVGDRVRSNTTGTGTGAGSRYVHPGELVGGYVLNHKGDTHKILANTGGVWNDEANDIGLLLRVDEYRLDTGGDCDLVWPRGVLILHPTGGATTPRARWRLRIPAQTCPDDYFQIGTMLYGPLHVFGQETSWGNSQRTRANYGSVVNDYGTERRRKKGPAKREWQLEFQDPINLTGLRAGDSPDYLAASAASEPLVAVDNVWWVLENLVRVSEGYSVPVVALNAIPKKHNTTITDPSLFLYGYLDGDVQFNLISGDEGSSEIGRVDSISVKGIVE